MDSVGATKHQNSKAIKNASVLFFRMLFPLDAKNYERARRGLNVILFVRMSNAT